MFSYKNEQTMREWNPVAVANQMKSELKFIEYQQDTFSSLQAHQGHCRPTE